MDVVSVVFLCGVEACLISIICTVFESSRFDLSLKQLAQIYFTYYAVFRIIVSSLVLLLFYGKVYVERLFDIYDMLSRYMAIIIAAIAYLLVILSTIILSCKILVKIRGRD